MGSNDLMFGVRRKNGGPCGGCTQRSIEPVNCHSVCEKYLSYAAECKRQNDLKNSYIRSNYVAKGRWNR